MKQSLLIRGARVVDPASDRDEIADILILEGRVSRVEKNLREEGVPTLDAKGLIACPGFIDMHVHLREPGQEYKETILSGTRAAVAGGFTGVACMANTNPPNDSVPITQAIVQIAAEQGACRVWPIAAVTKGMEGHELTEFGELKKAGAIALSDDGKPIADAALMRRALEYAGMFDLLIIDHAEEPTLSAGGQMHEGWTSTKLGLRGIPSASEDIHVARDMMLAELTGSAIHIAHLSTAMSLDLVRHGKRRGLRVSCEVAPHHFLLSDEAVGDYDTSAKMKPPLRTEADIKALLKGLHDGTIDCIATDHAPHHADEKDCPFDQAAFGIVGLETAVSLALHHLLRTEVVTLARLVALMSWNPARILGIPGGTLSSGAPGDVTLLDLGRKVVIDAQRFETKGRATPWHGVELIGGAAATVVGGRIAWTAAGGVTSR